jgi:hypothetical protein
MRRRRRRQRQRMNRTHDRKWRGDGHTSSPAWAEVNGIRVDISQVDSTVLTMMQEGEVIVSRIHRYGMVEETTFFPGEGFQWQMTKRKYKE